ncbi:MAG: TRAP transporter small permease subunit [Rhodospirillales bacterium]|nr:TRAP transporter small permease subunit [Rhodospirillales bacterium]
MRKFAALARACEAVVESFGVVASWSSLAIVLVMAFNVLLRYAFSTGSVAMQELEWHLMAPIALLGMSYAILKDGHVRVDVVFGRMPPRYQETVDTVTHLLVLTMAVIMVLLAIPYVEQSYSIGEKSPDPGGLTHRFLLKSLIPLGFALLGLQALAAALRAILKLLGRHAD